MDETTNLKLPYILAAQSQKHVTHNEALRALDVIVQLTVQDKDLSTPPGSPAEGARYIVAGSPTGAWVGHTTHVAAWQDGAWAFYAPVAGWLAWVDDESQSYLFSGGAWIPAPGGGGASLVPKGAWSNVSTYATGDLVEHDGYAFLSNIDANTGNEPDGATPASTSEWTYFSVMTGGGGGGSVNPVSLVGINDTADTTNRLAVSSPASLFSHEGAGHQLKINKDTAADTASVLFQTGFSGRAEFGLAGDDDFHVKVSADGSAWHESLIIDRATGTVEGAGFLLGLRANLLGTVSQSGGVPTGAVIEAGSNANGIYVRFADGSQICQGVELTGAVLSTASGSLFVGNADTAWTFPAVFSAAPVVVCSTRRTAGSGSVLFGGAANAHTTTTGYFRPLSTATGPTPAMIGLAFGRWF